MRLACDKASAELAARGHELHRLIQEIVHRHCHCPAFVGALELGLSRSYKRLHTIWLDSPGLRGVLGFFTSMSSFTIVMGTVNGSGFRWAQPNIVSEDGDGDNSCVMAMDSAIADVLREFNEDLFVVRGGHTWNRAHDEHGERSHEEQLDVYGADSASLHGVVQHPHPVLCAQKDPQDLLQEPRTVVR